MDTLGSILSVAGLGVLFGLPVLIGMAARAYNLRKISDQQLDMARDQLATQKQQHDRRLALVEREESVIAREREVALAGMAQDLRILTETPIQRAASERWNEITSEILSESARENDRSLFEEMLGQQMPDTDQEPVEEARTITPPSFESQRITRAIIGGSNSGPRNSQSARMTKLCFDAETEVLTERGWLPVADVTTQDRVCSLVTAGEPTTGATLSGRTITHGEVRAIMAGTAQIRPADRSFSPTPTLADYADASLDLAEQLAARTVRDATDTMRNETARIFALLAELDRAAKAGKSAKAEPAESKPRAERATNNIRRMQTTVELAFDEEQEDARG